MVKTFTTITLILLCSAGNALAQTARSIASQAAIAYQSGDFESAARLYSSMKNKGPGVWFNRGNCLYELEQYPEAIVAWKRAQQGASFNLLHRIDHQMMSAYEKAGIPLEQSATASFLDWGARCIHPFFLQLLFLLCWYLAWLLIITQRYVRFKSLYYVLLGLCIVISGAFLFIHYTQYLYKSAVVVKKSSLLAGPNEQYDVVKQLEILQDVHIRDERPGWYKVATHDQMGWVASDKIETV